MRAVQAVQRTRMPVRITAARSARNKNPGQPWTRRTSTERSRTLSQLAEEDRTMMPRIVFAVAVMLVAEGCSRTRGPNPPSAPMGTFTLQCDPFGGLVEHQPIDDRCRRDG